MKRNLPALLDAGRRGILIAGLALATSLALAAPAALAQDWSTAHWVGTWGAGPGGPPLPANTQIFTDSGNRLLSNPVSADDLIAGYRQVIARAHAKGIAVYGATLTPFEGAAYYSPEKEVVRQAVNNWIRSGDEFDGVIDFDRATRDPGHPTRFLPAYDSGDHLHPNDLGYQAMRNAVPLELFRSVGRGYLTTQPGPATPR
jgi:lysophospholipase L1-like esterase